MNIIKVCISAGCASVAVSSGSSALFYSHSLRIYFLHVCCLAGCINGDDDDNDVDAGAKRTIGAVLYPSCRLRWQHVSLLLLNYMPNRIKVFRSCFGLLSPSVEAVSVSVAGAGVRWQLSGRCAFGVFGLLCFLRIPFIRKLPGFSWSHQSIRFICASLL